MNKKEKIISLNDFKENRKLIALDGTPFTGKHTFYFDYENDHKEFEIFYKDGKENGLCTWWYENGQKELEYHYKDGKENGVCTLWSENGLIEYQKFFKDGIEVDPPWAELDENEPLVLSSRFAVFIKKYFLIVFYAILGFTLSLYIFNIWL